MNYGKRTGLTLLLIMAIGLLSAGYAKGNANIEAGEMTQDQHPLPFAFSFSGSSFNPWKDRVVNFHLSVFSGKVKGIQGLQLGAISNHVTSDFVGYDATGIYSRVDGNYAGFQAGGIVSRVGGNFVGMQTGGVFNKVGSDFFGLQSAGILNDVRGNFTGLQISGIHNRAENVRLAQISGISNDASDVEGVQIAGIVNHAKHVRGVQIGLINHSEKLDGIAIGLVNLSESGRVHMVSWVSSDEDFQVGVKFAPNEYWYTILTVGQRPSLHEQAQLSSFESHLGFHIPLVAKLYTEIDIGTGNTLPGDFLSIESAESHHMLEARIALGLRITPRLSIVAGLSNKRVSNDEVFWRGYTEESKPFIGIQI